MINPSTPAIGSHCCSILDTISEGVFVVDSEYRISTLFNRAAQQITGYSPGEALGKHCYSVLRADVCQNQCAVAMTFMTGKPVHDHRATIIDKTGHQVSVSITTGLLRDERGEPVGVVEVFRDVTDVENLRKILQDKYQLGDMISKNAQMQEIFDLIPDIAETDSTLLIQGPSGSGKGVLAKVIHDMSLRSQGPLVRVNCGAIPDSLLESELFGYVKGAFTDAKRDKPGRFSQADGGTLFLDEVGDMSPAMQVKLLRVLEDRSYVPLGGTKTITTDCRVIAASNKEIARLVERDLFRQDLFYRLNVIRLELPPLRERKEDIPLLIERLIAKLNSVLGRNITGVSENAMELLMNYHYPGNIRELENILEHACVLCKGDIIHTRHLPVVFTRNMVVEVQQQLQRSLLESSEIQTIRRVLAKHSGSRTKAARELGISRSTLWRKIKQFELD